jgi:hypothetical protein
MPAIWVDDEGKKALDDVKDEMNRHGLGTPSYSDAVRRLIKFYKPPAEN